MHQRNSLSQGVIAIGLIIIMAALLWWHSFFRSLAQQYDPALGETDPTLDRALVCAVYTAPVCKSALRAAAEQGRTPYSPWLLWLGIGITIAGSSLGARADKRT